MTVAVLMLAHDHLAAAGALARVLAEGRPFAVHVDARAQDLSPLDQALEGRGALRVRRRRCAWGMFSLVEAALDGVAALLGSGRPFSHVMLVSGADLPLRPLSELDAWAEAHPDTDLIEAVELSERRWVMDGLSDERFRLFHPFNWRTRRSLFDANVAAQRALRIKRRLPKGLTPALGGQWWMLSRGTLSAILADPQLPALKRFYRWSWIPDESFFQTLSRRHARDRVNLSPTLARFDAEGAPFVFHDDHEALLARSDHFFARKAHPRADRLRKVFLARAGAPARTAAFEGRAPEGAFIRARRARTHGREHLISPARFPKIKGAATRASAFPYTVIGGVGDETAETISKELTKRGDITCHARLFAEGEVRLAGGAGVAAGCLPASAAARDFWPDQYVINLARGGAGQATAFCFAAEDRFAIGDFLAADPGARVIWWRGAWALDLFRRRGQLDEAELAARAMAAGVAERSQLAAFRKAGAALTIRSAAILIDEPAAAVAAMLEAANARPSRRAQEAPVFAPPGWDRARPFLRGLQRAGAEVEASLVDAVQEDGDGP